MRKLAADRIRAVRRKVFAQKRELARERNEAVANSHGVIAELGTLRSALGVPGRLGKGYTPKEARAHVAAFGKRERAEGVRTLWERLRSAAGERGAEYLASLALKVGAVFGVRGPVAPDPGVERDQGRGIG